MSLKYLLIVIAVVSLINPSSAQYIGGSGKGDQQLAFSDITLNGTLLADLTAYTGGSGKGDAWIIAEDVYLSGVALSGLVYIGGSGKGDARAAGTENTYLTDKLFTGNTSTDFSLGANWTGGTFPNNETAIVPPTATQQPVLSGTQTIASGTTINILSGASLTIAPTGVLNVNGTLNNSGTLTLQSNATGSASIGNSSGTITGNAIVERFVPAVARRWRNFSPSVQNFTYAQLIDDIFITGPSGGIGFDRITSASINTYQEDTSGIRGWKPVQNINNTLSNGRGCIVYIRGDRTLPAPQWYTAPFVPQNAVTLDVSGTLVSGPVNVSLTYTNTNDTANDGWNLVGNPYASAINWSTITKNNLSPFYYILDPSTGAYAVNNTGIIESGQSFFVKAIGNNPSITFNETNKTTSAGIGYFKTSAIPITFKVVKDAITSDLAMLRFDNAYSHGYLPNEDALKLSGGAVDVSFVQNQYRLHINSVPELSPANIDSFWIDVNANAGNYTCMLNGIGAQMNGKLCYLTDTWLNVTKPLVNDTSFIISITSNALSSGKRFLITFLPPSQLPVRLISFVGNKLLDRGNELKWKTSSEINVSYFILERKLQGETDFQQIGLIKAKGNTNSVTKYSELDSSITCYKEDAFYRLRIVDNNSKFEYSNVLFIQGKTLEEHNVWVYPNPVKIGELIQIKFSPASGNNTSIKLTTAEGSTICSYANSIEQLPTNHLQAGIYFLEIIDNGTKSIFKVIVY